MLPVPIALVNELKPQRSLIDIGKKMRFRYDQRATSGDRFVIGNLRDGGLRGGDLRVQRGDNGRRQMAGIDRCRQTRDKPLQGSDARSLGTLSRTVGGQAAGDLSVVRVVDEGLPQS